MSSNSPYGGPGGFADRSQQQGQRQHQQYQQYQQQVAGGYGQQQQSQQPQQPGRGGFNPNRGVQWVSATNGHIPGGAVQGGIEKDGAPLFVARAIYKGGLHPGKAGRHIQDGGCVIGWGHKEINLSDYQILCGDASQLRWVNQEGELNIQGFRPVEAGHEETGEPLYVAKTLAEGSQQLGKCAPHIKHGMSFPYGHKERTTDTYKVLAYV